MTKKIESYKDNIIIKLKKSLYSKEILFQACYIMLEKCYFLLDEEDNYFIVNLFSKENNLDIKQLKQDFLDELIEAESYIQQIKRTSNIRELMLERALMSQISCEDDDDEDGNKKEKITK